MRPRSAALVVPVLALVPAAPALAHPELREARPGSGAVLAEPPAELRAVLSERVDPASRATVTDGCGRALDAATAVRAEALTVRVPPGGAGTWRVVLDLVSAEDGHAVSASYAFTVEGAAVCDEATPAGRSAPSTPPSALPEEPSGAVTGALLALVGAAVVTAALVVRRRTAG